MALLVKTTWSVPPKPALTTAAISAQEVWGLCAMGMLAWWTLTAPPSPAWTACALPAPSMRVMDAMVSSALTMESAPLRTASMRFAPPAQKMWATCVMEPSAQLTLTASQTPVYSTTARSAQTSSRGLIAVELSVRRMRTVCRTPASMLSAYPVVETASVTTLPVMKMLTAPLTTASRTSASPAQAKKVTCVMD